MKPADAMREPLAERSLGRVLRAVIRLRCPNCEEGRVIKQHFEVFDHCAECRFRFTRDGDKAYFGGAVFVNYMVCGGFFMTTLVLTVIFSWPAVPWNFITFVLPPLALTGILLFYPVSKVIWLTVDVWVRPVTRAEIVAPEYQVS